MSRIAYNFALPEEILQHQICTDCKQYLSCGPVKSYVRDGIYEVKCGRCVKNDDGGFVSHYNKLFENSYFPCVNRYEGCHLLVSYKESKDHEELCTGIHVACPTCSFNNNAKYSILGLINHFKSKHWNNFLNQLTFEITSNDKACYLHHDAIKNIVVLINVNFEGTTLYIKTQSSLKYPVKQRIILYNGRTRSDSTEIYRSNFLACLDFNDTSYGFCVPTVLVEQCQMLQCKMEFVPVGLKVQQISAAMQCNQERYMARYEHIFENIKEVNIESVENARVRNFPKIHRDDFFKDIFGIDHLSSYSLSDNLFHVTDLDLGMKIIISCYYCENFLATAGFLRHIYHCTKCHFSICGHCFSSGVSSTCPVCRTSTIKQSSDSSRHYYIHYYCRFDCEQYFRPWMLLAHEAKCTLNRYRGLSDEENIRMYFGKTKLNHDIFQQHNSFIFDRSWFSEEGNIYVVTRDDFRFIIKHWFDKVNETYRFKVLHKYDNAYVVSKILVDGRYRESNDRFGISSEAEQAYFVVIFRQK